MRGDGPAAADAARGGAAAPPAGEHGAGSAAVHAAIDPGAGGDAHTPLDARLVIAAGAAWGVTVLGIWAGWQSAAAAAAVTGIAGIAAAAAGRRGRPAVPAPAGAKARGGAVLATAAGILLAVCGFASAAAIHVHAAESASARSLYGTWAHASMTLSAAPRLIDSIGFGGSRRVFVHGSLESIGDGSGERPAHGDIVAFAPADGWSTLTSGQRVRFRGRFGPPTRRDLTVATVEISDPPAHAGEPPWGQRVAGAVRDGFARACDRVLAPDGAGLLRGLVLGDVSGIRSDVRDGFRATGLTHLTAVSGTHFALVCAMVLVLVRPLGPRAAAAATATVLIGYALVVGASPSVLRAALMGMIGLGALVTGRRRQALPALSATVLVLLAWRPALAVAPGFAMSVLATAALVVVAPWWSDRLRARRWPAPLADAVAVACAAHVATLPIVAAIAGRVSLVAVAANLLALPVVAPVMIAGVAAAAMAAFWPWGAQVAVHLAGPPVWWLLHVARWCAGLPWAQVAVPGGRAGGVVMVLVELAVGAWFVSLWFRRCAVTATVAAEAVWLPTHWTGLGP